MAFVGYARISTSDQDVRGQHDQLEAAGCARIWTDTASGALAKRPQLDVLLNYAEDGNTIVVARLDRLGRSLAHLVTTVTDLGERGIGVRSLHEQLDTTTASGRLAFDVFATLAEFEAQLTCERTQAGLVAANERGQPAGRPSVMTDERRQMARQMLDSGYEVAQVARTIGVARTTIYRHPCATT